MVTTFASPDSPPRSELQLAGFGVTARVADHTSVGMASSARARLPATLIAAEPGPSDLLYRVDDGVLHRGETLLFEGPDDAVLHWLITDIDAEMAIRATTALFMHAGVVARHGHAILMPATSGAGKSTLVAELVARGATYYSDEYAPIDADGLIHPYARTPSPRHPGAPPVTVSDEPRPPLPPAVVLATHYAAGAGWAPERLTGARALLPLVNHTVVAQDRPAAALAMARRLAPHTVTLSGPRGDAAEVADAILATVDDLIAARGAGRAG